MGGTLSAPLAAQAACDIACATSNLPNTPQAAAQQLMSYKASGQLKQATITNGSIFTNEIEPIANNALTNASCRVDKRAMQTLIAIIKYTGSVQVTDLNRHCANDGKNVCPSTSPHCTLSTDSDGLTSSTAMDIGATGDGVVDGYNNYPTANLRTLMKALVPRVKATGFFSSGADMGQNNCSSANLDSDYFWPFGDTCNHQHADYRGNSAPLAVSTTPTAPPPAAENPYPAAGVVRMPNGTVATASIDQVGSVFETNQTSAGSGFTAWNKLTNGGYVGAPATIVAPNGTLAIFARGTTGAIGLVAQPSPGSGFTNYGAIGVNGPVFASDPAVATAPNNTLVVVAVDTYGRLWETHQSSVGGTFAAWSIIASGKQGRPAILRATNGTMAVAVRTANNSFGLVAQSVQAGAYVDFGQIGINGPAFASAPAMALAPNGTVVVAGVSGDGLLWESNQTSVTSTFTAWTALAFGRTGTPTMLQAPNKTMAITARTTTGAISMVAQTAEGSGFRDFGAISSPGYFVSDPAMVLEANGLVGVVATDGTNNRFYTHQTSAGSAFSNWAKL